MKILVATDKPFAAVAVEGIKKEVESAGIELVLLEKYGEKSKLLEAVADADGIIIRSDIIDAEVIDAAKNLKVVVRAGAGYDNVDLAAATAKGVCVMNTPGQNSNAVAELVFGMTIMVMRNYFDGTSGSELKGKSLGIHAFGQVGRNVARIAKGIGMDVYAFDPYCPDEAMVEAGVTPVHDINELYSKCQFVSLHIPATDETKKSINYDLLKQMPKNAVLINTARKEVIDEESLIKLMEDTNVSLKIPCLLSYEYADLYEKPELLYQRLCEEIDNLSSFYSEKNYDSLVLRPEIVFYIFPIISLDEIRSEKGFYDGLR